MPWGFYQRTVGSVDGGQGLERHSSCPLWSAAGTGSPELSSNDGHRQVLVLTPRFSSLLLYLSYRTDKLGIPVPLRSALYTSPSAETLSWFKIL